MNLDVRYCDNEDCLEAYDIGTDYAKCPKCRTKKMMEDVERGEQRIL